MNKSTKIMSMFESSKFDFEKYDTITGILGNYIGGAIIQFRNSAYENLKRFNFNKTFYSLNSSDNDGWFRVPEKTDFLNKKYGLMVRSIKITSKVENIGMIYTRSIAEYYDIYKGVITYLDVNKDIDDGKYESTPIWLMVIKDTNIEDVKNYIKNNNQNWIP